MINAIMLVNPIIYSKINMSEHLNELVSNVTEKQKERVYYELMQEVGNKGPYQIIVIVISIILAFESGIIVYGVPYEFAVPQYIGCPEAYGTPARCNKYVCSLPPSFRQKYENPQLTSLKTFGNQFGKYQCHGYNLIYLIKGLSFFGAVVGYIIIGTIADNLGRKGPLLLCQGIGIVGSLIMLLSFDLIMTAFGSFLTGVGTQCCIGLAFSYQKQLLQNKWRQKMEIALIAVCCLGGVSFIILVYLFQNTFTVFWIFVVPPLLINILLTWFCFMETPRYLVKLSSIKVIREQMKFIAVMNGKENNFYQSSMFNEDYLEVLKEKEYQYTLEIQSYGLSYLDFFRYPSMRPITISTILLFFFTSFIYFLPLYLVGQFGFNFYLNGVIVNISQPLTFPFVLCFVSHIPRKKFMIYCYISTFILSLLLVFLGQNNIKVDDFSDPRLIATFITFFLVKIIISMQFQVMYVYIFELFPSQVSAMSYSLSAIMFDLPLIFLPQVINLLNQVNFPIMILCCLASAICVGALVPLRQTLGEMPRQNIEELEHGKSKIEKNDGNRIDTIQ